LNNYKKFVKKEAFLSTANEINNHVMNSKNIPSVAFALSILLALTGSAAPDPTPFDTITQVSSYNGLLAGLYDDVVTYSELEGAGDTGLGTFERMDGEMILLEGQLYKVDFEGNVIKMKPGTATPYATLVNFKEDSKFEVAPDQTREEATGVIEKTFENPNLPHALLIEGTFAYVKTRSVPQQEKPYPTLAELAANQAIFETENVTGTIVGFYYPKFASTLNVPGFHLHFLSKDRSFGGHILEFRTGPGVVARIDACNKLVVHWPDTEEAAKADMTQDRSAELQKVNRGK
jgi:acetolactate decarboxylase